MTMVSEVMTRDAETIAPDTTLREAADLMDRLNVGDLPICDGQKRVGMVTDRDIVVRAVSVGNDPSCRVSKASSAPVQWCYEDDDVADVEKKMVDSQIRRLPASTARNTWTE
ncbi:MAG: hypothetical protein JWR14_2615 [Caballeronia sp.]|jgi:CBS domain-containing protein|nr:hypothetical protein [Caballeronia sp.]